MKPEHLWLCLEVSVPKADAERCVELLWEIGTVGMEEREEGGQVTFRSFFPASVGSQRLLSDFHETGLTYFDVRPSVAVFEVASNPDDWVEDYKKNFHAFPIGRTFYIHPSWEPASRDHPVNLTIDPGHAFGTGTHESTQLCMQAMERIEPPASVVDVGTGSGILALAARKTWHNAQILAIDNDPQAVEMAEENMRRNAVDDVRLAVAGPEAVQTVFDLVLANLTQPIFQKVCRDVAALTGKLMILSGFTEDQDHLVLEYFSSLGFVETSRLESNGWVCLCLRPGN